MLHSQIEYIPLECSQPRIMPTSLYSLDITITNVDHSKWPSWHGECYIRYHIHVVLLQVVARFPATACKYLVWVHDCKTLRGLPHYGNWGSMMWTIVPATFQSKCLHLITLPMVMYHTTGSLVSHKLLGKKPTAVHCEEALNFSKPRCSYLMHVWYPLGQRQLHPTNHCHRRSLIACCGVSP